MNAKSRKYDLEERVIQFAVTITDVADGITPSRAGNHVAGQIVRAGTSPASNCGEAQSAESKNDFIHKMKIALKELKETRIWLRVILCKSYCKNRKHVDDALMECEELVRIFAKSVSTASSNQEKA
jgi:four helix bundle protein